METRTIVVKNIEIGPAAGVGTSGGGGSGGGGGNPLAWLVRLVVRVALVVVALAIVIPLVVLGLGCFLIAVVVGLLIWGMRRIFGVRGGPRVKVSAGIPGAFIRTASMYGVQEEPSAAADAREARDDDNDGREGVRVKR